MSEHSAARDVARETPGRTVIDDRVVEKIAAAAAAEIDHATGLRRQVVGRAVGGRSVRTEVAVDGSTATIRLRVAVEYPASVRRVTRAVRAHVSDVVLRYCGLEVAHIDITVSSLRRTPTEQARLR